MKPRCLFSLLLVLLMSCEEVIQINLKGNSSTIVAEGVIYNDSICAVKITTTSDYYSAKETTFIEDATVVIKKDNQATEVLTYSGKGFYVGKLILGEEGGNYQVEISHKGKTYKANSFMPSQTRIYSAKAVKNKRKGKKFHPYGIEVKWYDNPNIQEYYMLKFIVNGNPLDDMFRIIPDVIAQGDTLKYNSILATFESKDHVEILVFSVDKSVFTYFKQLNDVMGASLGLASSPCNPKSNFSNGAVGYFAALSYVRSSVIMP